MTDFMGVESFQEGHWSLVRKGTTRKRGKINVNAFLDLLLSKLLRKRAVVKL